MPLKAYCYDVVIEGAVAVGVTEAEEAKAFLLGNAPAVTGGGGPDDNNVMNEVAWVNSTDSLATHAEVVHGNSRRLEDNGQHAELGMELPLGGGEAES